MKDQLVGLGGERPDSWAGPGVCCCLSTNVSPVQAGRQEGRLMALPGELIGGR